MGSYFELLMVLCHLDQRAWFTSAKSIASALNTASISFKDIKYTVQKLNF
jgi:hypothetical protein